MTSPRVNFSALIKGIRATKSIVFPYAGQDIDLAVRPLLAVEEGEALAWGRAYAVGKGVKEPRENDPLYEIGVMAATVAAGCVLGADAPETPFFDGGPEQVLKHLDRDRIVYLYEAQQFWQDECSPRASKADGDSYIAMVLECAGAAEGHDPLLGWRPVLRASFIRTLARQHLALHGLKSPTGQAGSGSTTSPSSEPEQLPEPPPPSTPTSSS